MAHLVAILEELVVRRLADLQRAPGRLVDDQATVFQSTSTSGTPPDAGTTRDCTTRVQMRGVCKLAGRGDAAAASCITARQPSA